MVMPAVVPTSACRKPRFLRCRSEWPMSHVAARICVRRRCSASGSFARAESSRWHSRQRGSVRHPASYFSGLCCKHGEGAMWSGRTGGSAQESALARWSCSNAMASVRAHGPTPKARSTIRASPTMPPWMANIEAWALAQRAHYLEALDRGVGRLHRLKPAHRPDQLLELAVVGLDDVVTRGAGRRAFAPTAASPPTGRRGANRARAGPTSARITSAGCRSTRRSTPSSSSPPARTTARSKVGTR